MLNFEATATARYRPDFIPNAFKQERRLVWIYRQQQGDLPLGHIWNMFTWIPTEMILTRPRPDPADMWHKAVVSNIVGFLKGELEIWISNDWVKSNVTPKAVMVTGLLLIRSLVKCLIIWITITLPETVQQLAPETLGLEDEFPFGGLASSPCAMLVLHLTYLTSCDGTLLLHGQCYKPWLMGLTNSDAHRLSWPLFENKSVYEILLKLYSRYTYINPLNSVFWSSNLVHNFVHQDLFRFHQHFPFDNLKIAPFSGKVEGRRNPMWCWRSRQENDGPVIGKLCGWWSWYIVMTK